MLERLRPFFRPLNLAAFATLAAVGYTMHFEDSEPYLPGVWALLLVFAASMLVHEAAERRPYLRAGVYVVQTMCTFTLIGLASRSGVAPVLLVILVSQLSMDYPPRAVVPLAIVLNLGAYSLLKWGGHNAPAAQMVLYLGFEAFAALTTYYARSAERARDRVARVNADLLATRALLADTARDNERLRVARELHDVAGHKLTAMTLNLRALAADPAYAGRPEVALAQQLSAELLTDIRGIVQAMRHDHGLDLATALRALAAPMPRPSLRLRIAEDVRVTDPAAAEAVLRLVQEALTNSARHADADVVKVSIGCNGKQLHIRVEDDGLVRGPLREGNGLSGMRERVVAAGGELALSTNERGALRIDASLPA